MIPTLGTMALIVLAWSVLSVVIVPSAAGDFAVGEFAYRHEHNNEGFRNVEHTKTMPLDSGRILILRTASSTASAARWKRLRRSAWSGC